MTVWDTAKRPPLANELFFVDTEFEAIRDANAVLTVSKRGFSE